MLIAPTIDSQVVRKKKKERNARVQGVLIEAGTSKAGLPRESSGCLVVSAIVASGDCNRGGSLSTLANSVPQISGTNFYSF